MNSEIREEILTLAGELPDEVLPEVLIFLRSINERNKRQKKDDSSENSEAESSRAIAAYRAIGEKYKNALRELAK